jgi:hypothetical protein
VLVVAAGQRLDGSAEACGSDGAFEKVLVALLFPRIITLIRVVV